MITSSLIINQLEIDRFSRLTKKQICYHFLEIEIDLFLPFLQWEKKFTCFLFLFFSKFLKNRKTKMKIISIIKRREIFFQVDRFFRQDFFKNFKETKQKMLRILKIDLDIIIDVNDDKKLQTICERKIIINIVMLSITQNCKTHKHFDSDLLLYYGSNNNNSITIRTFFFFLFSKSK